MQREAFTLIESLVVILVVSVLLAIVLPSLGRARELARETRCLASIRSAQQLVTAYAQDATDLPPHGAYESGSLASGHPSVAVMYTGIGGFGSDYFTQCYLWGTIVAYWQRDAVLGATCPGSPATMQSMRPPTSELIDSGTTSSYRLSAAFLASRSYWVSPAGAREIDFAPQRLAHVQYPSAKSLLYEHDVLHLRNKPPSPLAPGCSRSPVAYVDGHAAAEPFKHLVAVTTPHDFDSPMPFSHTINGIVGRDAASK
ncbi:MAG: prepilin-type N-terminal cleavage/methylation domain-containing protein [Phycisphaeraceae bacterium]|nr:prepilin-type N-terminal cleavage/methylation domain-containing protein [Phycisphaeraceae bacterium]